jgi:integrase/recombinase XerD
MRSRINEKSLIQLGTGHSSNPAFQTALEGFLASLKGRKHSANTVKKRRDSLRRFLLYLDARGVASFADVDLQTLEEFRLCLVDHDYSESEIESSLRSVRLLFRHMEEENLIFDNPAQRLKIRKATLTLGKVLTEKEVQALLAAPDLATTQGVRDRALLEVLYSTGLRRGEAAGLRLNDVDLERGTVKVLGKGRKERLIPLGKQAVKYLGLYIKEARPRLLPKLTPPSDALWYDRLRQRLSEPGVCHAVIAAARRAGVAADTHTLRRTCATHLLRGGAHPAVVAQLLGHSGLRSLSHYLRTTITDLQKAHAMSKPGR